MFGREAGILPAFLFAGLGNVFVVKSGFRRGYISNSQIRLQRDVQLSSCRVMTEIIISVAALLISIVSFTYSWWSSRKAEKLVKAEKSASIVESISAMRVLMASLRVHMIEVNARIGNSFPEGEYVPIRRSTWQTFNEVVDSAMLKSKSAIDFSDEIELRYGPLRSAEAPKAPSEMLENLRGSIASALVDLHGCIGLAERLIDEHVDPEEFNRASKALLDPERLKRGNPGT